MVVAAQSRCRIDRTLEGRFDLDAELGDFGRHVGGRRDKARQAQSEDFCLRQLLLAWDRLGKLTRPLRVTAPDAGGGFPDFELHWPGSARALLGIEVTEAASEQDQHWHTKTENKFAEILPGDGFVSRAQSKAIAADVGQAIGKKCKKLGPSDHRAGVHLLVYVNGFIDMGDSGQIVGHIVGDDDLAARARSVFAEVHLILGSGVVADVFGAALPVDLKSDYAHDFFAWSQAQAKLIREGKLDRIDAKNLAEEIESMGRADRRSLQSQLSRLLLHLLKWKFQPDRRSKSWTRSIAQARDAIDVLADENPSLSTQIPAMIAVLYPKAARMAAQEMSVDPKDLPSVCPFTTEEVHDPDFLPQ